MTSIRLVTSYKETQNGLKVCGVTKDFSSAIAQKLTISEIIGKSYKDQAIKNGKRRK